MAVLQRSRILFLIAVIGSTTNTFAHAYITSHGAVPSHRQKQWLQEMTADICQVKPGELSPNQLSQAPDLMYAWSHTKDVNKECALNCERLVKRVVDERRAGNPEAADLTVEDYNCLLEGWARSGEGSFAAERCEVILTAMQEQGPKPNLASFKHAIMAWRMASSDADFGPVRAQRILEWMIRLAQDGENPGAMPDAFCFDTVMQMWSRSKHKQAPAKAEQLLGVMERLYEKTGSVSVKPRTLSFNAILAAWSRSGDDRAAKRACDILSFMEMLVDRGDHSVAPDSCTYCTVMGALAKSQNQAQAARKAETFLRHVEEAYQEHGQRGRLVPDTILFNTAMGCLAKSNVSGSYRRAQSILDRQRNLYQAGCKGCKPDVYGYTSVIASCAAERGSKKEKLHAFDVALATFRQLQNYESGPNHVSYGAMLKACAKLLPSSSPIRQKWARVVFEDCCKRGQVGDMVVSRMREAASPELYKELMQGHRRQELPAEWTRNVDEKNQYRKKKASSFRRRREV